MSVRAWFWLVVVFLLIVFLSFLPSVSASNVTITGVGSIVDTYVRATSPTTNYVTSANLYVGNTNSTYIAINFSVVPSGSTIRNATLHLNNADNVGCSAQLFYNSSFEDLSVVTWNSQPNGSMVAMTGYVIPATSGWLNISVFEAVNASYSLGGRVVTLLLSGSGCGSSPRLTAMDAGGSVPYLEVGYDEWGSSVSVPSPLSENASFKFNISLVWGGLGVINYKSLLYYNSSLQSVGEVSHVFNGSVGNVSLQSNLTSPSVVANATSVSYNFSYDLFLDSGLWLSELPLSADLVAFYPLMYNFSDMTGGGNDGSPVNMDTVLLLNFDDGTATDLSGYGNDGVISGGVSNATGVYGNAMSFDGVDNSANGIIVGDDSSIVMGVSDYTFSAWVNVSDKNSRTKVIFDERNSSYAGLVVFVGGGSSGKISATFEAGTTGQVSVPDTDDFNVGQFYNVVVTVNRDENLTIFIDGVRKMSKNISLGNGVSLQFTHNATLGNRNYGSFKNFNGTIDEVAIYKRVLNASEVGYLYSEGRARFYTNLDSPFAVFNGTVGVFDGVDDFVSIVDSDELDVQSGSQSISFWMKSSDKDAYSIIISKWNTSSVGVNLAQRGTTGLIDINYRDVSGNYKERYGSSDVADGVWHHIVTTYLSNASPDIYIDGVLANGDAFSSGSVGSINVDGALKLGFRTGSNYWNGSLSDVRVYNRSLSSSEVSLLYNRTNVFYDSLLGSQVVVWGFPRLNVSVRDVFNNSLSNFSFVFNGGSYTASGNSSFVLVPDGFGNYSLWVNASGFFPVNVSVDTAANVYTSVVVNVSSSDIEFRLFEKVSNSSISNFTVQYSSLVASTTSGSTRLSLPVGVNLVNVTVPSYYNTSVSVSVSALDNRSVNVTNVFNHKLSVFVVNALNGSFLSNFSVNVSYGSFLENIVILGSNESFNVSNGLVYDLFLDKDGFAKYNVSVSPSGYSSNYTFYAYTSNSLNLSFFDSETFKLINWTNVSVVFIGDSKVSGETFNGTFYIDGLSPSEYFVLSSASGYRQNTYILTVNNRSTGVLNLYLQNSSTSSLVLITVKDKFGTVVDGADITIQRFGNNSWFTEQIVRSDFQGRAEAYFVLSTVYYNFLIDYNDIRYYGVANSDSSKKVVYAEDVTNGLNFFIGLLEDVVVSSVYGVLGVDYSLSYVNLSNTTGYFRFYYDDPDNIQRTGCLSVKNFATDVVICSCASTSVLSESSTITCNVNSTSGETFFVAAASLDGYSVGSLLWSVGVDDYIDWGLSGYLAGFVLLLVSFFMFLRSSPTMGIIFGSFVFVGLSVLGVMFDDLTYAALIVFLVLAFLIAGIKSKSGVN